MPSQYENIFLNQSRVSGKVRLNPEGLGWKAAETKKTNVKAPETLLLSSGEIQAAFWSRAARGYEIRIQTKTKGAIQLDGFDSEEFNALKTEFDNYYNVPLEVREHSLRGWNWGKADFGRNEMSFDVAGKPAFEISYADVSNSNLAGKNEVTVEFNLQSPNERLKAGDELVEIRFFVPGTVVNKTEDGEKNNDDDVQITEEEQSAATAFYEALKEKADIGDVAGEAIVSLPDIMFLTPRGRYDIDMYSTSFGLRGKTYDYKIPYKNVQRLFLLPKPDEVHHLLVVQLDPPARQGQTKYPFFVIQFPREDELEVELNIDDAEYEANYKNKLKKKYDEATHEVVGSLFRGLTNRKMMVPGSYKSTHGDAGVSCSLKASEGYLFVLETCFLFLPKPTVYIPISEISVITFSRIGSQTSSSSRTFDMAIALTRGGEHQFSNINKDEQKSLEDFIRSKGITIEMDLGDQPILRTLAEVSDSDGEIDRGSADEDEESPDEDFQAESESDVAEEFDSEADPSSSEDEGEDSEEENRIKKKPKN